MFLTSSYLLTTDIHWSRCQTPIQEHFSTCKDQQRGTEPSKQAKKWASGQHGSKHNSVLPIEFSFYLSGVSQCTTGKHLRMHTSGSTAFSTCPEMLQAGYFNGPLCKETVIQIEAEITGCMDTAPELCQSPQKWQKLLLSFLSEFTCLWSSVVEWPLWALLIYLCTKSASIV